MILLLHGVPTSGEIFAEGVAALRARGLRAEAPDLPRLERPTVRAMLRALGPHLAGRPVVVGVDYGGLLALEALAEGLARAAVVTSSPGGLGWAWARLSAVPPLHWPFYHLFQGRFWVEKSSVRGGLERYLPADPEAMLAIARGISLRRLRTLPARTRGKPVLWLWGAQDRLVPAPRGATLIEGAAQQLPWDQPEAWAEAVAAFTRAQGEDDRISP